jgi:hypothetical protein
MRWTKVNYLFYLLNSPLYAIQKRESRKIFHFAIFSSKFEHFNLVSTIR